MTHDDEFQAVGFGGAFARQFRLLWMSRRPILLAVGLLAVLVLAGAPWTHDAKMRFLTAWPVWLMFVPIIWSFAVFYNEGPSSRFYFWSLPTGRAEQTLARVAAGLAWLWLAYLFLFLAGWMVGLIDGDAWQLAEIGLAGWVNYLTGPLITYLVICILTVPSDYPIRWFFGLLLAAVLGIVLLIEWLDVEDLVETIFEPLVNQDWGLGITIFGGLGAAAENLDHTLRAMRNPTYSGSTSIDLGTWWTATPLWTLLFLAIVVFIASRHPDRLPRVRLPWRR